MLQLTFHLACILFGLEANWAATQGAIAVIFERLIPAKDRAAAGLRPAPKAPETIAEMQASNLMKEAEALQACVALMRTFFPEVEFRVVHE